MRITTGSALTALHETLLQLVAPHVTDPDAAKQLQAVAGHLARLGAGWDTEALEARTADAEMEDLLRQAAAALAGGPWAAAGASAAGALAALPAEDGTMTSLFARQDALLAAMVPVIEALEQAAARAPDEGLLALRAAVYNCLIAQHPPRPAGPRQPAPAR